MLRPQKMSRVVIAGTKDHMDKTIKTLYNLNLVHIEDYHEEQEGFSLGRPLKRGSRISEDLVNIRSISKNLGIDKEVEAADKSKRMSMRLASDSVQRDVLPLQKRILTIVERINALERRKTERENTRELLTMLSAFPIPLELYSGFRNLETYVGTIKTDPRAGLDKITRDYELFKRTTERGEMLIALFVSSNYTKPIFDFLNSKGFSPIDVPIMKGNVKNELARVDKQLTDYDSEIAKLNETLDEYKTKHKSAILAGEEFLSLEVEKTDAPLRFATSKNAFITEGWIPTSKLSTVNLHLSSAVARGLHIEVIEEKEVSAEIDKEPPIQLDNPQGAKPYEYLIDLFSLPSYKEFDPTLVLYLIFPVFFGFMIGDLGYGIALMILAVIMGKVFPSEDARNIAKIVFVGGIFSIIFGLLIFGDAFGIPFHAHVPGELNWSDMLGIHIPIYSAIQKLDSAGVIEMLVLSMFAAFIHLGLGFLIGISNEIGHNKKHAIAKAGWFIVLLAIFLLIMNMSQETRSGAWIGNNILFNIHINAQEAFGLTIPILTIILALIGIVILIGSEGPMAIMEILSLMGNMISYSRLAAIGVAKGAVAAAFNTMIYTNLIADGNIGTYILASVFIFLSHMLVILLGALSSGIQAVRLNYVEFFLKFYKGGGKKFKPFGAIRKYTF
jgi:V/A-type H+-transporting ATPase subunit I